MTAYKKSLMALATVVTFVLLPHLSANATGDWAVAYITPNSNAGRLEYTFDLVETEQVLMYGLGPSVADRLQRKAVSDPMIWIFSRDAGGSLEPVITNRDWQDAENADDVAEALKVIGATLYDVEAAVLATLAPGQYVVRVLSEDGSVGNVVAGATSYDDGVPPDGDIKRGEWSGIAANYDACVFVSVDGTVLADRGSSCGENGDQLDISVSNMVGDCSVDFAQIDVAKEPVVEIVNNSFGYGEVYSNGFWGNTEIQVVGTFSGDVLTGTVTRIETSLEQSCTGEYMATPAQ